MARPKRQPRPQRQTRLIYIERSEKPEKLFTDEQVVYMMARLTIMRYMIENKLDQFEGNYLRDL